MAFTMKEVVERTGISPYTLRFYEKEGVLPAVDRDANGVRKFSDHYVDCVEMVQALRSTGLPLAEIKEYAELYKSGNRTLPLRKMMLLSQKNKVEDQISRLMKALEKLNYKLALIDAQENRFERLP
ncbi:MULTISPECIES: MerR family transcriptional regulator [Paenibacillus]|uniref:MerR family transcriptional regulator n=1 Tax=Paenibacillus campinasensis TaxID=66347 RepID=A0A268EW97_9BACL|nr:MULTISPECIES: MerR family transcriptional regulator [Paenibacillus]MUG68960.1 MerR family transcriptional regulator [Paenibacillus campinasensis]PAD77375.1 MerR family transcriptional regulator [Paenibacillus campinasensis]PAK50283.1 MerR family transcriptional regulator [Paenibacillus sp. 7541]